MFRYYSTRRPIMPGGLPKTEGVIEIKNFDRKTFCEEIKRIAWGYVEYETALTQKEADEYELTPSGMKTYYCVTTSIDDNRKIKSNITDVVDAVSKPENVFKSLKRKDIYIEWFESQEEAEKLVEESKIA